MDSNEHLEKLSRIEKVLNKNTGPISDIHITYKASWGVILKFKYHEQELFIHTTHHEVILEVFVWNEDYPCNTFHEHIPDLYPFIVWPRDWRMAHNTE